MKHDDLGPLPESDRQDDLDELGLKAVFNAFPVERFRVRAEPGTDRGVDRYLEVKVDNRDTNCRSHIQLKSTEKFKQNKDGSVSKPIEVKNINYLLDGPCPLYFLWIEPQHELRFAWAQEEALRLYNDNPAWMEADTVVFRFHKVVDSSTLDEIHKRILDEARLKRKVLEALARASQVEELTLSINTESLSITTASDAEKTLLQSGMSIVAAGYGLEARRLFDLVDAQAKRNPRIRLVAAYAELWLGRHEMASAHLRECALRAEELSEEDIWFRKEIQTECDYKLARISTEEYLRKHQELSESRPGIIALHHKFEIIRQQHLGSREPEVRALSFKELETLAEEILNHPDCPKSMALNTKTIILYARGNDLVADFLQEVKTQVLQSELQLPGMPTTKPNTERLFESWNKWREEAGSVFDEALKSGNPILTADAAFTEAAVTTSFLNNVCSMVHVRWIEKPDWFQAENERVTALAENAAKLYSKADSLHSDLRARLLYAELQELAGMHRTAVSVADGVIPLAEAMDYQDVFQNAKNIVSGHSQLHELTRNMKSVDDEDNELGWASVSDGDAFRMAREYHSSMSLPAERFEHVHNDIIAMRAGFREVANWCRDFRLYQHLAHLDNHSTAFAESMRYICKCEKHGYQLEEDSQNWQGQIDQFKQKHCKDCDTRIPKSTVLSKK